MINKVYGAVVDFYVLFNILYSTMNEKSGLENMVAQIKQLFVLLVDEGKLFFIESVSLIVAEFLALLIVGVLLLVLFSLVLLAIVWLLSMYVGFPMAAFLVSVKLLLLCVIVYSMRRRLFVNSIVARLCAVLFACDEDGKKL